MIDDRPTPESDALFLRQVSDEGTCVVKTDWRKQYEGCQSLERRLAEAEEQAVAWQVNDSLLHAHIESLRDNHSHCMLKKDHEAELAALRAENERLREALTGLVDVMVRSDADALFKEGYEHTTDEEWDDALNTARAALAGEGK